MLHRRFLSLLVGPVLSWSEDRCPNRGVQFKPWCKSSTRHSYLGLHLLMIYSVNEGTTLNGQYLDQFLGKSYETEFLAPFSHFLNAAFGKL